MSLARLRRLVPAWICLSTLATGCASMKMKEDSPSLTGSFINGGVQKSPAADANPPTATESVSLFGFLSGKQSETKISPKTQLAYAQWEERQGAYAASRNKPDEQRAAYAAARKGYEQVLAADSKSVDAVIGLARLDEVAGRAGEAEQGFLKAVRMDGNSARSLDALGQFYAGQQRWTDALPTFQRAMAGAPQDQTYQYHYAIALARSGQIKEAEPLLVRSVGKANADYNIGVILHERGDVVGSEERFMAAIVENPRLEAAQHWLQEIRRDRQQPAQQVAQQGLKVTTLKAATPAPATAGHVAPAVQPAPAGAQGHPSPAVTPAGRPQGVIQQVSAIEDDAELPVMPLAPETHPAPPAAGAVPVRAASDPFDSVR